MMDRKEEKAFPEVLKETICAYKEDPAEDKFIDLLCLLWDGIEENGSVPVPAEMDWDKMTIRMTSWRWSWTTTRTCCLFRPCDAGMNTM